MGQKLKQIMNIECKSQSTKNIYNFHVESFKKYCDGDVNQEKILDYLNYLVTDKKYKPSSLNLAKFALIYYFREIRNEVITVKIPQIQREKLLPKVVSVEVIKKLIEYTTNLKHRIVIELLYSSGIRLDELVNVKWVDIDFNFATVFVKGKRSKERISKLSKIVMEHLKQYMVERYNKNNVYVFDSLQRPHTHVSKKTVQMILRNACRKAKLDIIVTPHMLRHSFATHLTDKNVDIRVIQELLGHSSPRTTMIYTKVSKERLRNVKSPMDYM